MRFQDLCEAIRQDEITLETAGHHVGWADKEHFLENYDEILAMSKGSYDGKWSRQPSETKSIDEINQDMRDYHQRQLDYEVEQDKPIWGLTRGNEHECRDCGERLRWVLTGKKLQLRCYYDYKEKDFVIHPADFVCEYSQPKPTTGIIKVASPLVITNFFAGKRDSDPRWSDAPKKKEFSDEYSLNSLRGRINITKYKVSRNVAYGQMGNMSIGVYANKAKDSVIIGPPYHPAEMGDFDSDAEYEKARKEPLFPGYKFKGRICLDVWRWEATDLNTVGDELFAKLKEKNKDMVVLDVPHGEWKFEHYYDVLRHSDDCRRGTDPKNYTYARLNLQKA